jgi:hypothetical protein
MLIYSERKVLLAGCWLVAGGWFVLREKDCWLVADKPSDLTLISSTEVGSWWKRGYREQCRRCTTSS